MSAQLILQEKQIFTCLMGLPRVLTFPQTLPVRLNVSTASSDVTQYRETLFNFIY